MDIKNVADSLLNRLIAFASAYIGVGVVVFHIIEDFGWIDSLYFVVVTLGTVGYGDLAPKTEFGRVFTVFYIIFGIGVFVAFAKAILARALNRRQARVKARKKNQKKK